jgi:hypothetical protein
MHHHLRYEANAQQVLREGAGVISPLGVDTLQGNDTRRCLRCEDNAQYVPRWGAGVVDSLWTDNRRGAASCLATVALSPSPVARRVAGQTRMLLFRHEGKASSSSPPSGELTTIVIVVATVAGHELETPEAEHRPGLKRLLKTTHLELNGKVFVNTQQAPTWCANCRRFRPGGPSTEPTSEFIAACPCPDGLVQDGTQGGMRLVLSRTGGARSRGYKRRKRERETRDSRLLPPRAPRGRPWTSPFIDVRRVSRCTMGV